MADRSEVEIERSARPVAFIVGFPRSGTTWLQRLVASHPDIASPQETFLFSRYLGPQIRAWTTARRNIDARLADLDSLSQRITDLPTIIGEPQFRSTLHALLDLVVSETLTAKPGSTVWVEKTPDHTEWLSEIEWLLPDAPIIHVVRPAEQAVASLMHAPWARRIRSGVVELYGRERTVDELARQWRNTVGKVRAFAEYSSNPVLEVDYDDLRTSTASTVATVLDHIGAASDTATVTRIVGRDRSNDGDELVLAGELRGRLDAVIEPEGFDRRTRPASAVLDDFERWRVARATGAGPSAPLHRAAAWVRHGAELARFELMRRH